MFELSFIAYILSLISIACNIWLYAEIRELRQEKKRVVTPKKPSVSPVIKVQRPKGHWD